MDIPSYKYPITVIIAAKNEEANIYKCLKSLNHVQRIILLDSNSIDNTVNIALDFNVDVFQFNYKGVYPKKRQWALENIKIETDWIFFIDADEVVPNELWFELKGAFQTSESENIDAFMITKGFHFMGSKFRYGGFSHRAVLLFRKGKANFEHIIDDTAAYQDMEVHERLIVQGKIGTLKNPLIHEDFKGLTAYIDRHNKYSSWEAIVRYNYLKTGKYGKSTITANFFGNTQERRRFIKKIAIVTPFEPLFWFLYHYIYKLGIFEGKRGLIASQVRSNYIVQVRAKIYELKVKNKNSLLKLN